MDTVALRYNFLGTSSELFVSLFVCLLRLFVCCVCLVVAWFALIFIDSELEQLLWHRGSVCFCKPFLLSSFIWCPFGFLHLVWFGACLWISISHFPPFGVHLVYSIWCDLVSACGPVFLIFLHLVSNEEFRENVNDEERGKDIKGVSELAPVHFNLFTFCLAQDTVALGWMVASQVPQPTCYWHSWQLGNLTKWWPACMLS